jgi:hypothetical protein
METLRNGEGTWTPPDREATIKLDKAALPCQKPRGRGVHFRQDTSGHLPRGAGCGAGASREDAI